MEGQHVSDYLSSWGLARLIAVQMALRAAIELNVFDIVANSGPEAQLSSAEIVSKIPTTNPNAAIILEKILRMLSAHSLLSTSVKPCSSGETIRQERTYGLTMETRCLVTNGDGLSLAPILLNCSQREAVEGLYKLKDAVLEPGCVPFHKANGADILEYASMKPDFGQVLNKSMAATSKIFFDAILKEYGGFEELTELMDVGGGIGSSLKKIVSIYPHIHCANLDLPHVIADAPKYPGIKGVQIEEHKNMEGQHGLDYLSSWGLTRLIAVQMTLRAAIELNVFDIIANSGPDAQLSSAEIVSKIPTTNPNAAIILEKILGMLSAHSLLSTSVKPCSSGETIRQERTYGLTMETRCLVTNGDGLSLAPIIVNISQREIVESLYKLKDAVLEPGCVPFHKANGADILKYASKKPEFGQAFNQLMAASSKVFFEVILTEYGGFEELTELMDVGGGIGISLKKIVSIYPHIHCVNLDLPHVIADAPKYPDVEHVAGDMFESLPNAQTILLKWILHDWDDDMCMKLLRNCWKALPDNGKVIVVEYAIPQVLGNDTDYADAYAEDFFMMALLPGAKERTTTEFDDLAKVAGFAETKFIHIARGIHVLEFFKRTMG